jgi:hypothetical protein
MGGFGVIVMFCSSWHYRGMGDQTLPSSLPSEIADAVLKIPRALISASIKALDRLIGSAVDIPVAWLGQQKARIDAQTEAYKLVEGAIAHAAATEASGNQRIVASAVESLVRKAYRKQINSGAVATVMLEDLRKEDNNLSDPPQAATALDEDWLNVFERYAEDASTERMQNLWGRVLAGEIRKPGRYSMRTLRFLSEFSQVDGIMFADFCKSAFGESAPNNLVKPDEKKDIKHLIFLESSGLIQGAHGLGLGITFTFNEFGKSFIIEGGELAILMEGIPGASFQIPVCVLTPLGQELLTLLPGRDARQAARNFANAIRRPEIEAASLVSIKEGHYQTMEILWQRDSPQQTVSAV